MHKFVRNLLTEWRRLKLPFEGGTFVVGVSGGADSVALAVALADLGKRRKLRNRFVVAHFDHGLRGAESAADAAFVEELAGALELEFVGGRGKIPKQGNLEQNARRARYRFLLEIAESKAADAILTAHTLNDQAETFLLNLLRGSGPDGLSAMMPVVMNYKLQMTNDKSEIRYPKSEIDLVRPLLNWATRHATEDYCNFSGIEYREDAMNENLNFSRVRVRKLLLPLMAEFNPKIVETLARTAGLLRNRNDSLNDDESLRLISDREQLPIKELKTLAEPVLYKVLRGWLAARRGHLRGLELKHIGALERLIHSRKSGRVVELPDGETVVKESGKLAFHQKNG